MDYETLITEIFVENLLKKAIDNTIIVFDNQIDVLVKSALYKLNKNSDKDIIKEEFNAKEMSVRQIATDGQIDEFKEKHDIDISEDILVDHIKNNLQAALTWSNEVNFSTALSSKKLKDIFIDIDLYLAPIKTRFDANEDTTKISSKKIINKINQNKIVYGGAGAGKTTLIKKVFNEYVTNHKKFDFSFPIVIRFRELEYDNSLIQNYGLYKILIDILGVKIKLPPQYSDEFDLQYHSLVKNIIISFFNDTKILLIADGFDEIPDSRLKKRIERDFQDLSLYLKDSKFILTSRSNDFLLKLTKTDTYEICPLNDTQIKQLTGKWIKNKKQAQDLFDKIKSSPYYDTTMRPLTLSHLCAIYERKKTIPPKPRYVYDFILNLLLETWDQQRSVVRPSKYADFYIEKKKEFLAHLSYWLSYNLSKNVFNSDDIRNCYNKIHKSHNLPVSQAKKVVTELENHTGIFVQAGFNSYQFSHKSLQEFLTAKYLSALPVIPDYKIMKELPNEMAILISLSANPNYFFDVLNKDFKKYDEHFWFAFLNRLVEEKPDFGQGSGPIIFFLNQIWLDQQSIFQKAFLKLFEQTNIRIAIKEFSNDYKLNGTFDTYASFIYNDLKIPLIERNLHPSQIHIKRPLYDLIKKHI